jgi:hypothetical protein
VFQVVCKPGATKVYSEFEGEVYALTKDEGGRHTPFTTNYRCALAQREGGETGGGDLYLGTGAGKGEAVPHTPSTTNYIWFLGNSGRMSGAGGGVGGCMRKRCMH